MMRYGRDYGDRGFLDRAANTVRGWLGHGRGYDGSFRTSGWDESHGGYGRGYDAEYRGGMNAGQGGGSWSGRNPDWDRTPGRAGQGYRTGGYQPRHGGWDVGRQDRDRGMSGGGVNRGGMGGGYDRGYREVMTIRPSYDHRDDVRTQGVRMSGDRMDRDSMDRGGRPGRYDQDMDRPRGGMAGGMRPGGGMLGNQSGAYGFNRFRSNYGSGFGGQYYTGYGVDSGSRG